MKNLRKTPWQLPDGMDEMLPPQALVLEQLRRRIYDLHLSWGYEPVNPPFVEYLESLLSTAGQEFDRQTYKVADPMSGRMIGLRADMTPQVARIDAHTLGGTGITRLFYMGTVIRAYADSVHGSRSPLQMGAEVFGHNGIESDVEVIRLMLATLRCVGVTDIHVDLGHADIFRSLSERLQLDDPDQALVFDLLQRKAENDLSALCTSLGVSSEDRGALCALCSLNGDESVLEQARAQLAGYGDTLRRALDSLAVIGRSLRSDAGQLDVHFDLAEVRGYQYHNGAVFAAYVPQRGVEIARGGRYDGIGEVFGSKRPATGYSTDLKTLMSIVSGNTGTKKSAIRAPLNGANEHSHRALQDKVNELRDSGEVVITLLSASEGNGTEHCDRQLVEKNGQWLLEKIE